MVQVSRLDHLSVCLSVLWQNSSLDPDAIWDDECYMGVHVAQGEGFNGLIFNRNVFDSCVKISEYFYKQNI